jgi:hypothetical protein
MWTLALRKKIEFGTVKMWSVVRAGCKAYINHFDSNWGGDVARHVTIVRVKKKFEYKKKGPR